ncbi:molecular chaperone [Pseudomonas monteilii]|uniref:molecular chaperone n=1 Tax=Pseudomonas alabamensis TaxID=3064349 RepID=UPI0021D9B5EF|nr:molecular chaperone [Pseudomonas entomophila]
MRVRGWVMLVAALAYPWPVQAAPEINVGTLYDYLDAGSSTLLKRVRNGGDSTAFVKVSVAELVYDADGKSREIPLDDLPLAERGLVVSPARLIVPARGMQAMRVLYRGDRSRERYFRLRFIPVLPERGDGFAVSAEEAKAYGNSLKAGVQLLTGYGTLLFVRPKEVRYDTPVRMQDGRLQISNRGNSTVVLDHFRHCAPQGHECAAAAKHHLLPGRTREFPGQPGRLYRFELQEGDKRQEMAINE